MLNKVLLALLLISIIIVYIQRIDGIEFWSIRRKKRESESYQEYFNRYLCPLI